METMRRNTSRLLYTSISLVSTRLLRDRIYPAYRLNLVHAWNLFGNAAMSPNDDEISEENGVIYFGIMNFVRAFDDAVTDFLDRLKNDKQLQQAVLSRYAEVMAWEKKGATAKTASAQK